MPSWNIHTAHVEYLLAHGQPDKLGIRDTNAFLFGNIVPDVYVGYMVKNPTRKIRYGDTHFVDPGFVPEPRFWEFWEKEALPAADGQGRVSDLVLGAWCHLVADNLYNHHTNQFLVDHDIQPGEQTRIRKQGDFDLFGRTLDIDLTLRVDEALLEQATHFPQYEVAEEDVRSAVEVQDQIVRHNQEAHIGGVPDYAMLTPAFFAETFAEVDRWMSEGLSAYASEGAQAPLLRKELPHVVF